MTDDGTRLFALQFYATGKVVQYNLTSPYNILSASYLGDFSKEFSKSQYTNGWFNK